ncbi:MAG TPA: CoA pyrophosphatase [Bacteroidetes bacterium]|nr:CoA pyrophosphatase [Bacteroidota bacterium]
MKKLIDILSRELKKPLPGLSGQNRMASFDRSRLRFPTEPGDNSRTAAVLLLLYPRHGKIFTVFIQRPSYPGIHGGQISLPGGKSEPGDLSPEDTALRETREEIGITPSRVLLLGKLSPLYIPASDTVVQPVVGAVTKPPAFRPDPTEVEFVIETALEELLDPQAVHHKMEIWEGHKLHIPYYNLTGYHLWGATAMILSEFIELLQRSGLRLPG